MNINEQLTNTQMDNVKDDSLFNNVKRLCGKYGYSVRVLNLDKSVGVKAAE